MERDSVGSLSNVRNEVRYQPGMKRFLGNNQPLSGLTADDPSVWTEPVLAAAWHELVEKAHTYLGAGGRAFCGERLRHAVVSIPATSPPQTRLDAEQSVDGPGCAGSTRARRATAARCSTMCEISGDLPGAEVPGAGGSATMAPEHSTRYRRWIHRHRPDRIGTARPYRARGLSTARCRAGHGSHRPSSAPAIPSSAVTGSSGDLQRPEDRWHTSCWQCRPSEEQSPPASWDSTMPVLDPCSAGRGTTPGPGRSGRRRSGPICRDRSRRPQPVPTAVTLQRRQRTQRRPPLSSRRRACDGPSARAERPRWRRPDRLGPAATADREVVGQSPRCRRCGR
jgi:hypothetical protein